MTSSAAALIMSVRSLVSQSKDIYFWTFTYSEALDFKDASKRWNHFNTVLKRKFQQVQGVRVFELHADLTKTLPEGTNQHGDAVSNATHGLHVHALLNTYLPVEQVRKIAEKCGFGRINVKKADDLSEPERLANYLAKYLRKGLATRPKGLKGLRLWATFGTWPKGHTRVKDIEKNTSFTELLQYLKIRFSPIQFVGQPLEKPFKNLPFLLDNLQTLSLRLFQAENSDCPLRISRGVRFAWLQAARRVSRDKDSWDFLISTGFSPRKTVIINV